MLTPEQMMKTERTDNGCLLWTGALANGYPAAKHLGKTVYLKRLIWEGLHGAIPDGGIVISTCGERTCIESSHMGLGRPGRYPRNSVKLDRQVP